MSKSPRREDGTTTTSSTTTTDNDHNKNDSITDASNLQHPKRIVIVTTAGLPWRTGTAVNPLLRALALLQAGHVSCTLVVPWLASADQRYALYGTTTAAIRVPADQEAWIRTYAAERSDARVARQLGIRFWQGSYNAAFGSIFPTEDLCALIDRREADVVILEEPEHLNWFRVPISSSQSNSTNAATAATATTITLETATTTTETTVTDANDATATTNSDNDKASPTKQPQATTINKPQPVDDQDDDDEIHVLGWARKFPHVIGILHTNYAAYIRQYNMATSFVTARALNALSAMCLQAYCHVIIRLSPTLPNLLQQPLLERTCNVHGVGSVFLEQAVTPEDKDEEKDPSSHHTLNDDKEEDDTHNHHQPSPNRVYFIGKIIWAKGFDKVLEVQEQYKAHTGHYFGMDVYGKGDDSEAIQRAFYGRRQAAATTTTTSTTAATQQNQRTSQSPPPPVPPPPISPPSSLGQVFAREGSLRDQVESTNSRDEKDDENERVSKNATNEDDQGKTTTTAPPVVVTNSSSSEEDDDSSTPKDQDVLRLRAPPIPEVLGKLTEQSVQSGAETADAAIQLVESVLNKGIGAVMSKCGGNTALVPEDEEENGKDQSTETSPQNTETKGGQKDPEEPTSPTTATSPSAFSSISAMASWSPRSNGGTTPTNSSNHNALHHLLPARSRFKWRKHPIPATFWGVKDHAELRQTPQSCVFLNMSTTEVLCTTSAEALAMGKFVILPKHPSNEFFLDFPNCLSYSSLEECVEQLLYAHANDPKPLSAEHRRALSWEGATERLYEAAAITHGQVKQRQQLGLYKEQQKAAKTHVDMARKSQFVSELFSGKMVLKRFSSSVSTTSSASTHNAPSSNGNNDTISSHNSMTEEEGPQPQGAE